MPLVVGVAVLIGQTVVVGGLLAVAAWILLEIIP